MAPVFTPDLTMGIITVGALHVIMDGTIIIIIITALITIIIGAGGMHTIIIIMAIMEIIGITIIIGIPITTNQVFGDIINFCMISITCTTACYNVSYLKTFNIFTNLNYFSTTTVSQR